jgi:hypothetical protein
MRLRTLEKKKKKKGKRSQKVGGERPIYIRCLLFCHFPIVVDHIVFSSKQGKPRHLAKPTTAYDHFFLLLHLYDTGLIRHRLQLEDNL